MSGRTLASSGTAMNQRGSPRLSWLATFSNAEPARSLAGRCAMSMPVIEAAQVAHHLLDSRRGAARPTCAQQPIAQ